MDALVASTLTHAAKDSDVKHITQKHPSSLSQPGQRDLATELMNKKNDIKLVGG
jgi:hypothetical protein